MPEAHSPQSHPQPFPRSQRELVGLALQRGARRPAPALPPVPHAQRDRVRQALALGVGGAGKGGRGRAVRASAR